jgi:hypothetical protein
MHDCLIEAVTEIENNDIIDLSKHAHKTRTQNTHIYTMNMRTHLIDDLRLFIKRLFKFIAVVMVSQ